MRAKSLWIFYPSVQLHYAINQVEMQGVMVNTDTCMGCTICTKKYPELFKMENKKATVKEYIDLDIEKLGDVIVFSVK